MSLIQIHGEKTLEYITKIMDDDAMNSPVRHCQARRERIRFGGKTKYMNSPDRCIFCGCGRAFDIATRVMEPLVGHHVRYFPPLVAWVHYRCHAKIHGGDAPHLIQYDAGDSRRYYEQKKTIGKIPKAFGGINNGGT